MIDWQKALLLLFLVVVVPTAIYGVYVQYHNATRVIPEIRRTLVEPYAAAIKAGDYTRAYRRYTSRAFREAHSLDEYLGAQQANLEDLGPLVELTLKQDAPFQSAGNLFSGRRYHQGSLVWRGEKREAWVNWEVTLEDDMYTIDAMAEEFLERLSPRIF
jgi:hypothetical protein